VSLAGQRIDPGRYAVIPRTLVFLTRPGEVLLQRVPPGRGAWAGLYNGLGGHVERGEDPLTSARREVREESGLIVEDLRLRGIVIVDAEALLGIGLYVFTGEGPPGKARAGPEGGLEWIQTADLLDCPLVEDLHVLLPRLLPSDDSPPFAAVYTYAGDGRLTIHFAA
jgi:8-oxo-dGTP diphosphatase